MNRMLLALGASVLAAAAFAQDRPPAPAGAEVYFIAPHNGAAVHGPVTVKFGLKRMGVAPAGVKFDNTGKHTLELLFADYQHIPFDPALHSQKITITVK